MSRTIILDTTPSGFTPYYSGAFTEFSIATGAGKIYNNSGLHEGFVVGISENPAKLSDELSVFDLATITIASGIEIGTKDVRGSGDNYFNGITKAADSLDANTTFHHALYAQLTGVGGVAAGIKTGIVGSGASATDFADGNYSGVFTTDESIFDFSTVYNTGTQIGSGVYLDRNLNIGLSVVDRNNTEVLTQEQLLQNPFISGLHIDILNSDGTTAESGFVSGFKDVSFEFSEDDNEQIFGSYTKNFGIQTRTVSENGLVSTGKFFLFANEIEISTINVIDGSGQFKDDNAINFIAPDPTLSNSLPETNRQKISDANISGEIQFTLRLDDTISKPSTISVYGKSGSADSLTLESIYLLRSFDVTSNPLNIYRLRLTQEDNIVPNTDYHFKFVPESTVGTGQTWTVGPYRIQGVDLTADTPITTDAPNQSIKHSVGIGTNSITDSDNKALVVYAEGTTTASIAVAGTSVSDKQGNVGIRTNDPGLQFDAGNVDKANVAASETSIDGTDTVALAGSGHFMSGDANVIAGGQVASISGGNLNFIGGGSGINVDHSTFSTSIGGRNNDIFSGDFSVIGGGLNNLISGIASDSHVDKVAIVGGEENKVISAPYSFIGAGNRNLISGTNAIYSSIIGGGDNEIKESQFSAILGGDNNTIEFANHSVSAGNYSKVKSGHAGAFVFSDSRSAVYESTGGNTLNLRFESGVFVDTESGIYINGNPVVTGDGAESDTLQTVTARGADTTIALNVSNTIRNRGLIVSNGTFTNANITSEGLISGSSAVIEGTISGGANFLGTGDGDRITKDNIPYMLSGDSLAPGSIGTLQQVTNNGATTTNNIGIGTNSPVLPLHVEGSVLIDAYNQTSGSGQGIFFRQGFTSSNKYNLSILTHNDGDTSPDALDINAFDGINFCVGSNSRNPKVSIKSNGAVGIGTTNPSALLSVGGGDSTPSLGGGTKLTVDMTQGAGNFASMAILAGNAGRSSLFFGDSNAEQRGAFDYRHADDSLSISTAASEKIRITSAGNVGIGTDDPSEKLEVSGNLKISSNGVGNRASSHELIFFGTTSTATQTDQAAIFSSAWATNSNGGELIFETSNSSNNLVERMRIDGQGFVGIGTDDPQEKLHVDEGFILADGASTNHGFELRRDASDTFQIRHLGGNFTINNLTDSRKDLSIDGDGKVGIGTDDPDHTLHVEASAGSAKITSTAGGPNLYLEGAAGNLSRIRFNSASGAFAIRDDSAGSSQDRLRITSDGDIVAIDNKKFKGTTYTSSYIKFSDDTTVSANSDIIFDVNGSEELMRLEEGGNVGIGTTIPLAKLDVRGNISGSGDFSGTGDGGRMTLNGTVYLLSGDAAGGGSVGTLEQVTTAGATTTKALKSQLISITGGGTTSPVGVNGLHLMYDGTSTASINAQHNGTSNRHLTFKAASYAFNIGNSTFAGTVSASSFHQTDQTTSSFYAATFDSTVAIADDLAVDTDALFVDVSANRVGINEDSVDATLHLTNVGGGIVNQKFERAGASAWRLGIPNGQTYFAFDDTNDDLSTAKVVITKTDGYVGIGTNSPGTNAHLEIYKDNPQIVLTDSNEGTDDKTFRFININEALNITARTDGNTANTAGGDIITLLRDGQVGINDTSPDNMLSVSGSASSQLAVAKITRKQASASNNTYTFEVDSSAHTSNMTLGGAMAVDVNAGRAFTINGFGRVGIGITNPQEKLHVSGNALISGAPLNNAELILDGPTNGESLIRFKDNGAESWILRQINNGNKLAFRRSSTDHVVLDNAGNVGIGTDSPSSKLELNGTLEISPSEPTINLNRNNGSYSWKIVNGAGGGNFPLSTFNIANNAGTPAITIVDAGNVGIGTTNPTTKLEVSGAVSNSVAAFRQGSDGIELTTRTSNGRQQIDFLGTNTSSINAKGSLFINYDTNNDGSNDNIVFARNGADEAGTVDMVIKEGKVGIGSDNPTTHELDVVGGAKFTLNVDINNNYGIRSFLAGGAGPHTLLRFNSSNQVCLGPESSNLYATRIAGDYITLEPSNFLGVPVEAVRVVDGGNVGIGTQIPSGKLHVENGASSKTLNDKADELVVESLDHGGISILTPDAKRGQLYFNNDAFLRWVGDDNKLSINTSASSTTIAIAESAGDTTFGGDVLGTGANNRLTTNGVPYLLSGDVAGGGGGGSVGTLQTVTNNGASTTNTIFLNGSASLYVNAGSVGIGTTGPQGLLDVKADTDQHVFLGRARFGSHVTDYLYLSHYDNATSTSYALKQSPAGSTAINAKANMNVSMNVNNSPIVFVKGSTSNVGIGTDAPARKFEVYQGYSTIVSQFRSAGSSSYITLANSTSTGDRVRVGSVGNDLILSSYYTNPHIYIKDGGNVGIGTNDPLGKLEVNSSTVIGSVNAGADDFIIQNSGYAGMSIMAASNSAGQILFGDENANVEGKIQYFHSDDSFRFSTNQNEAVRITSAGKVGIGTNNPNLVTHIYFTGNNGLRVQSTENHSNIDVRSHANYGAYLRFMDSSNRYWIVARSDDKLQFRPNATSLEAASIYFDETGRVGVGVSNPTEKLEINPDTDVSAHIGRAHVGYVGHPDFAGFSHIDAANTSNYALLSSPAGSTYLNKASSQQIYFRSANSDIGGFNASNDFYVDTDTLYVDASENRVGIGSESPTQKLDVAGAINIQDGFGLRYNNSSNISIVGSSSLGLTYTAYNQHFKTFDGSSYTEHMTIATGGNVGIGTNSPAELLHVEGSNATVNVVEDGGATVKLRAGSVGRVGTYSNHDFSIVSNSTDQVRIKSDGRVGIGTNNPQGTAAIQSALDCSSDFSTHSKYALNLHNLADDNNESIGVSFGLSSNATAVGAAIAHERKGPSSFGDLYFLTRPSGSNPTERMRITSAGKVGIGTDDPDSILHLDSDGATVLTIEADRDNNDEGDEAAIHLLTDGGLRTAAITAGNATYETSASGNFNALNLQSNLIRFHTAPSQDFNLASEKMRLTPGGNLGIGTTNPQYNLEIYSGDLGLGVSSTGTAKLVLEGDINNVGDAGSMDASIEFLHDAGAYGYRISSLNYGGLNALSFSDNKNGTYTDVLHLGTGGHVGVGTDDPAKQLDIDGDTRVKTAEFQITSSAAYTTHFNYQNLGINYISQANSRSTIFRNNAGTLMALNSDGDLLIGQPTDTHDRLMTQGAANVYAARFNGSTDGGQSYGVRIRAGSNENDISFLAENTAGTDLFVVRGNGKVGIGTGSPSNALDVVGHFSATSKSFLIDHPTKENKKLQYASLEGPENGVYVRGTTNSTIIELPDYWSELVHEDSITVVLTPIGKKQDLYIKSKSPENIMVGGVEGSYDYVVYGERKDIDKLEIEPLKV